MITPGQIETLKMARDLYGEFIRESAARHGHRPEVIAGIMMRETECGTSPFLDKPGPEGRGDSGHGHGLMQLDDRDRDNLSFINSGAWKDPKKNIDFGCLKLRQKRLSLKIWFPGLEQEDLERASIAAYNCGQGNVAKSIREGKDFDYRTAHKNYSVNVLLFAQAYKELK